MAYIVMALRTEVPICSYGRYGYGLYRYVLYSCGERYVEIADGTSTALQIELYSHGLYSYGLYNYGQ